MVGLFSTIIPISTVAHLFHSFKLLLALTPVREFEEKLKHSISSESGRRENFLLMRLNTKEQEIQDLIVSLMKMFFIKMNAITFISMNFQNYCAIYLFSQIMTGPNSRTEIIPSW